MSYTIVDNTVPINANNATFRAWGSWISLAFANSGMVAANDTGQINWTTVTVPTAVSQSMGYEIWRFNDALQNTAPAFFKVEYGSSSAANTVPAIWYTVGSGSAGNGTLTGLTTARTFVPMTASNTSNRLSYFCGNTGYFVLAMTANHAAATCANFLSAERSVDANGNATTEAILVTSISGLSSYYSQVAWNSVVGNLTVPETTLGVLTPSVGGGTQGANTAVYPLFHTRGGTFFNPGLNILGYFHADFATGANTTVALYGANHTYRPLGNTCYYGWQSRTVNNSLALMIRWE